MYKFLYSPIQSLICTVLFLSSSCFADYYDYKNEPDYTPYFKVSAGYILNQPDDITNKETGQKIPLFEGDDFNYSLEMGISVIKPDSNKEFHLGLAVVNLVNQGESSKYFSPYKVEVFGDYVTNFSYGLYTSIGVGYKLACDNRILLKAHNPYYLDEEEYFNINNSFTSRITARFAIGKKFGKYHISLDHHSQWLEGKPFNDEWEYHVTAIAFGRTF